jgi:hypothetical protein
MKFARHISGLGSPGIRRKIAYGGLDKAPAYKAGTGRMSPLTSDLSLNGAFHETR